MNTELPVPVPVVPAGHFPNRQAAQEFYTNIIGLGKLARDHYIKETREGRRAPNFTELRELEENIKVCELELAKYK